MRDSWIASYYMARGWQPESPAKLLEVARRNFESDYKIAGDRLWNLGKLRGADTDPTVKQGITDISTILKNARNQADTAKDAPGVLKGRQMLAPVESKAQKVEEASQRVEEAYKKDLESMPKYMVALEGAKKTRDTISTLAGTKEQLLKIEKLLSEGQSKVISDGKLIRGHAEGLKVLSGHEAILNEAKQTNKKYLAQSVPQKVVDARDRAEAKIAHHGKVAPEFQMQLYLKQLAEATEGGRDNPEDAVEKINKLAEEVQKEVEEILVVKSQAEGALIRVKLLMGALGELKVPESEAELVSKEAEHVESVDLPMKEFRAAVERLARAEEMGHSLMKEHSRISEEWKEKEKSLKKIKERCVELKKWVPLHSKAQILLETISELEEESKKTRDLTTLGPKFTEVENLLKVLEQGAKEGIPEGLDLDEFISATVRAKDAVDVYRAGVVEQLDILEKKLGEGVDKRGTEMHVEMEKCFSSWLEWVAKPPAKGDLVTLLEKRRDQAQDELLDLEMRLKELLTKPVELGKFVEGEKKKQADADTQKRPGVVTNLLDELAKFNIDVSADRNKATQLIQAGVGGADELAGLEKRLRTMLEEARNKHAEKQKVAKEKLDNIDSALKRFASDSPSFTEHIKELKAQASDVRALIESGDPYLYQLGAEESGLLVDRMHKVDPEKQPKGAKKFADVEKKWGEISKQLGAKDLVKNRMPDTYARLYAELQEAIALAQRSSPEEGMKALEPIGLEVEKVVQAAGVEDQLYKQFQEKKKAVEDRWSQVTKLTRTWMTDRTTAFADKFKTLMADAQLTASQEGQIHNAMKKLDGIETELERIASSPNPRQALQEEDVKAAREQSIVADMARQFEVALTSFRKITLTELREAMKKVEGADLTQVDSLEKVADQAEMIVDPYLKILSSLPHKQLMANRAPMMDKATADFAQANRMLSDGTTTARRLAAGPQGTNVNVAADLTKVAAEWTRQATAYGNAVKALRQAITDAASGETEPTVTDAVKTALADLNEVAARFRPEAFADPMKTLCDDKAGEDKKLGAREAALRVVRSFTQELLNDPVMIKINDPKNPFRAMNSETSLLRAALKKLELGVLVGI